MIRLLSECMIRYVRAMFGYLDTDAMNWLRIVELIACFP